MVSPLTAVAHSPLLESAPRAWWQAMQWAQLQLRSACYMVISVMSQCTACFSCAPKSFAGHARGSRMLGALGRISQWRRWWRPVCVCAPACPSVGALWELPIPYHREEISCKGGAAPPPLANVVCSEDGASPNCRFPWSARCSRCSSTSCAVLRGLCVYGRSLCILLRPTLVAHVRSQYVANC